VAAKSSPTLRQRELSARLRDLRLQAGLTIEQVAEHLLCSPAKISRIETAKRGVSLRDVRDLTEHYGVPEAERPYLMDLARQSKDPAWWQNYDLPAPDFVGLETAAVGIEVNELTFVPALLQTEDYARALIEGLAPKLAADVVQDRVKSRMIRQQALTADPPVRYWAVMDEGALQRVVGGPAVMREQYQALSERALLPNVTIQVIPFAFGAHPGMEGNFTILEFEDPVASGAVYIEGRLGYFVLEDLKDVERYRRAVNDVRAVALSPRDSLGLIKEIASFHDREGPGQG